MELIKVARTPPVIASPEFSVARAVGLMVDQNVGAVVIVDGNRHALGIFTERDNLIRVTHARKDPEATKLSEVMTAPVQTALPEMTCDEALTRMIQNRFRHLPVVDGTGCVIGIASVRYLLMRRLSEKQATLDTLAAYVEAGGPG
jgi:CBS domain-containing protein